jgi:hypothetical protein
MCGSILERRRKSPAMVVPFPRTEPSAAEPEASESISERAPERNYDNRIQVTDAPEPGEFAPADAAAPPPAREPQRVDITEPERPREVMTAAGDSIFGDLTPVEDARDTSIGGPSILGLGGDSDGDYLLEDEDRHTGRKWLLAMFLVLVAVLLVMQWRSGGFDGNLRAMVAALLNKPTAQPSQTTAAPAQSASAQKPQSDQGAAASEPAESKPANANESNAAAQPSPPAQPSEEKAAASKEKPADESAAAASKTPPAAAPKQTPPKQKPEDATEQQAAEDAKPGRKPPAVVATPRPAEAPGVRQYARAQAELSAHNCQQALVYFRAAADAGSAAAASKLGAMYATGNCAPQDRAEAYRWISRAATQEPANTWLARNRDMLWSQMTPQERSRAR